MRFLWSAWLLVLPSVLIRNKNRTSQSTAIVHARALFRSSQVQNLQNASAIQNFYVAAPLHYGTEYEPVSLGTYCLRPWISQKRQKTGILQLGTQVYSESIATLTHRLTTIAWRNFVRRFVGVHMIRYRGGPTLVYGTD